MEDGAHEQNAAALNCALSRLEDAENPTDVDGSRPRKIMLGLCLLPQPPAIAWTLRKGVSDLTCTFT